MDFDDLSVGGQHLDSNGKHYSTDLTTLWFYFKPNIMARGASAPSHDC